MRKGYRVSVPCFLCGFFSIVHTIAIMHSVEEEGQWLHLRDAEVTYSSFDPSSRCHNKTKEECLQQKPKRRLNPSVGEGIKVLVLPVKFADHVDREVPTLEYLEEFFNGNGSSEINEIGSVREWLRQNSNGKYVPQFVIRDWEVSTKTEVEIAAGKSGWRQNFFPFFQFALEKVDNDPEHDWWTGFVSPAGYLNHLVVLHSGYMAESSK